jgi:hypothetical protein
MNIEALNTEVQSTDAKNSESETLNPDLLGALPTPARYAGRNVD